LDTCGIPPWRNTHLSSKPVDEVSGVLVPQLCCDRINGSNRAFGKQCVGTFESNFRPVFKNGLVIATLKLLSHLGLAQMQLGTDDLYAKADTATTTVY
jgi:hypothetical protein